MAGGSSALDSPSRGKTSTSTAASLDLRLRSSRAVVRFHYFFLAPAIVFSIPSKVTLGFSPLIVPVIVAIGLAGIFARKRFLTTLASLTLLASLFVAKIGSDLVHVSGPDTAVLLLEFVAVIFFMKASEAVIFYDIEATHLEGADDPVSEMLRQRLYGWLKSQLGAQFRLSVAAFLISLALLVVGGFANVSVGQLPLSSIFVLVVVAALLFLITQKREPDRTPTSV